MLLKLPQRIMGDREDEKRNFRHSITESGVGDGGACG